MGSINTRIKKFVCSFAGRIFILGLVVHWDFMRSKELAFLSAQSGFTEKGSRKLVTIKNALNLQIFAHVMHGQRIARFQCKMNLRFSEIKSFAKVPLNNVY